MGVLSRLTSAASTVSNVVDRLVGDQLDTVREKVGERVKETLPNSLGPRGILRIENPDLQKLASEIDKFDGNNNGSSEPEETRAKVAQLDAAIKRLEGERDSFAYSSPEYLELDRTIQFMRTRQRDAGALERYLDKSQDRLTHALAGRVIRDAAGILERASSSVAQALGNSAGEVAKGVIRGARQSS